MSGTGRVRRVRACAPNKQTLQYLIGQTWKQSVFINHQSIDQRGLEGCLTSSPNHRFNFFSVPSFSRYERDFNDVISHSDPPSNCLRKIVLSAGLKIWRTIYGYTPSSWSGEMIAGRRTGRSTHLQLRPCVSHKPWIWKSNPGAWVLTARQSVPLTYFGWYITNSLINFKKIA